MDEFESNLEQLLELVQCGSYSRIVVFARPGEGKTHLLKAVEHHLGDHDWNIFSYEECTVDSIEPPYILPMVDPLDTVFSEHPEKAPEVYFVLSYSQEYKQAVSGVPYSLGVDASFRDYFREVKTNADLKVFSGPKILEGPDALRSAYEEAGFVKNK